VQRHCDKEKRDEQRRRDRKEQHRINAELRMAKKLDIEALLASLKDAFTAEMKDTFDGLRSDLLTWKTSINDSMTRNTTTLQVEMKAAIDTSATISLKATVNGMMDTVPSRLDILEARTASIPAAIAEEPPPSLPPESNAVPPPAALSVVLSSDPLEDMVILTPWVPLTPRVPDRVPDMFAAECVHQIAPPHISLQSNLASPGLTTGNSGNNAPMAKPPDTMANSQVAFAALRARMSQEAAGETIGHTDGTRLSHAAANGATNHSPLAPSAHATSGRHVTPTHYTPSQPSN